MRGNVSTSIGRALPWSLLAAALLLPAVLALRDALSGSRFTSSGSGPESLSDYGVVPDFGLVDRSRLPVRRADLAGRVWVASFVYTRCQGSCPRVSTRMAELDRALDGRARLVSFSVDPRHDTPEVLSDYAARLGASDRWLFLTGEPTSVRKIVAEGFHLSAVENEGSDEPGAITHSDRVALVDRDLRIRRYYLPNESGSIGEIVRDVAALDAR